MRERSNALGGSTSGGMRRRFRASVLVTACVGLAASAATADTLHRYSFNTPGAAEDTGSNAVGGLTDGTLLNGATVSGGMLMTTETGSGSANTNPEVTLPLFVGSDFTGSFSIQQYFTRSATALNNYSTAFAFSDGSTVNYSLASAGRGDGTNQYGWAIRQVGVNGGVEVLLRGGVLAAGSTNVAVNVFDSSTGTASLYMNGVAVARTNVGQLTGFNLSNLAVKAGINGNSPFGDRALGGSTDEFRLDNSALTATQVAINFLNGANDNSGVISTNNGTASGDYNDGGAWSLGTPTASQLVVVNNTKTLTTGSGLAGILRVNGGAILNVAGGTLAPTTNLDLVAGSTVNLTGGTLRLSGITVDGDLTSTVAGTRTINLSGGILQAGRNFIAPAQNVALNITTASTIDSNGFSMSLPGVVTGSSVVTKIGAGTAAFTGDTAAYTGAINVSGGTFGVAYAAGTHTGASAFSNPVNLDPTNSGAAGIGFVIGQSVATDVTSTITLGQPTVATQYTLIGGAGTNQFANYTGKVTGGNANTTLSLTGFFKFDSPTSDFTGPIQVNANTAVALAGPNSLGGSGRTLISNGGGIEPQTPTALTGANKFVNPISILGNQAIFFTGNNNIDVASTITGTLNATNASISDIQKSGYGVVSLQGTATNIRSVVLNGGGFTTANTANPVTRVFQFATNFSGTNPSTATARGGIVDDNGGNNFDTQYVELTGGVTVSNLVLSNKGRQNNLAPLLAGTVLNSVNGTNTWAGGLQISNGGGGQRINVASGSTLNIGGVINNNVGGSLRGYELSGAGNGVVNGVAIDGTYYVAAPAASQLALIMIGETDATASTLTNNGSWSLNAAGNTLSGSIQVVGGRFNVNGSTTSTSTAASNQIFGYGGTLGGTGSIAQPVYIYAPGQTITLGAFSAGFSATNPFLSYLSYLPNGAGNTTFTTNGGAIDPGTAANTIGTLSLANSLFVNGIVSEQLDGGGAGSADRLTIAGALTLGSGSTLNLSQLTSADDALYILASYGSLTGTFGTINGLPSGYSLNYNYNGLNQIALIGTVAPAALYFTGATGNSLNVAGNYSTDLAGASVSSSAPGGGSDVYFASTNATAGNLNATLASNLSVNSLTFGTGVAATSPVTIGGSGTLTINAGNVAFPAGTGITVQSGAAAVTINANVALGASQRWTNNAASTLTVGGAVNLNANTLTFAGSGAQTINGNISGSGGVSNTGTGTVLLAGTNNYSGVTTVNSSTGVIRVKTSASAPILSGPGGANIANGRLVFDYAGSSDPAAMIRSLLVSGYANGFATGQLRSSSATALRGLGYLDDVAASTVTVRSTLYGDADIDTDVDFNDLLALAKSYGQSSRVWAQGDFNYDGTVEFNDLLLLAKNYSSTAASSAEIASLGGSFAADFALAQSLVPEPTTLASIGIVATALLQRRRARSGEPQNV